jgi:hypothetical protein
MGTSAAERRAIVPLFRTEKLPERMSLRVWCLELYSFKMKEMPI